MGMSAEILYLILNHTVTLNRLHEGGGGNKVIYNIGRLYIIKPNI